MTINFTNLKPGFEMKVSKIGKTIGLFGKQGAGKTSIIAKSDVKNIAYISFEGASALLRSMFSNLNQDEKINLMSGVMDFSDGKKFKTFVEILTNASDGSKQKEELVKYLGDAFKGRDNIVFDSITVFKKLALEYYQNKGVTTAYGALSTAVYNLVGQLQTFVKEILTQQLSKNVFIIGMLDEKIVKKSITNERGLPDTKEDVSLELEWKNAGDSGKKTFLAGIDYMFLIEQNKSGIISCFSYDPRASEVMRQNQVVREMKEPTLEKIIEAIQKAENILPIVPEAKTAQMQTNNQPK